MKYFIVAVMLVGCGDPANPPVVDNFPRLKAGTYAAYNEISGSTGSCDWVRTLAQRGLYVEVTEGGSIVSPLGNDLKCETIYPKRGRIEINCTGLFKVRATGVVATYVGGWSYGQAVLEGNVSGCKRLEVDWNLIAKEASP